MERERTYIINERPLSSRTVNAGRVGGTCFSNDVLPSPHRCISILGLWGNTIMHAKLPIHCFFFVYNYLLITYSKIILISYLFDR